VELARRLDLSWMSFPVLFRTRWLSQSCRRTKALMSSDIGGYTGSAVHVSLSFKRIYAEPLHAWLVGWVCGPVMGP